jgi:transcriptional regulator with XRE-family HTH domain
MAEQPLAFGAELRRRRIAAGLTLGQFARQLHYSKGYLSKIETGEKPAGPDLARRCDAALEADGELAALVPPRRSPAEPPPDEPEHGNEVWMMTLAPDGGSQFVPVNRRDALIAGVTSLVGLAVMRPRPAVAARQDGAVAAFDSMFQQYRQLGQVASPGVVLPPLIAQTNAIRGCATAASGADRAALFALAGRYAEYTGWMAQESGDDRASEWWTRLAVELAAAGGDASMAAYAQVRQALITLYRDDATQTVDLARRAAGGPGVPPRIRGLAAQREAQGYALAGQERECRLALDRAAALLTAAPATAEPVIGWATVTDPVSLVTGWCLHDLGHARRSAEILGASVARIPKTAHRNQARFGARYALALAGDGEIDEACAVAQGVLDHAELVDSATIRVDLRRLSRTLARWRSHLPVRELAPRLTAALHVQA